MNADTISISKQEEEKTCTVCKAETDFRCSRCQYTHYCGHDHQQLDWKLHKYVCRALGYMSSHEFEEDVPGTVLFLRKELTHSALSAPRAMRPAIVDEILSSCMWIPKVRLKKANLNRRYEDVEADMSRVMSRVNEIVQQLAGDSSLNAGDSLPKELESLSL